MRYLIFVLLTVLSSLELVPCLVGRTWEFLEDRPNSQVVLVSKGSMTTTSKVATTAIQLPASCFKVSYVRVEVDNPVSIPKVSYDERKRSVRIAYDFDQVSESQYKIYVKAVKNCKPNKKAIQPSIFISGAKRNKNKKIKLDAFPGLHKGKYGIYPV